MTDFGGWEMPVEYEGIIEEHSAVRENCGLFDITHMGEIFISGPGAEAYADYLLTNKIEGMDIGRVVYSPMCYEDGGVVDDLMIYRTGEKEFMLVVNAANTEKDHDWIEKNAPDNVSIDNATEDYALLALQGPEAPEVLQKETDCNLDEISYLDFIEGRVAGVNMIISRTGYTGEDGFELYFDAPDKAEKVWNALMSAGEKFDIVPVGLGARDTLRLEKCLPLYGHELSKDIHPFEANIGWTVKLDKEDFIGKEALKKGKEEGYERELAGFIVTGRGIARHGYSIEKDGVEIGEVSSGSYSPTLEENIGLGFVKPEHTEVGTDIDIIVRNRSVAAEIVEIPFV